MSRETRAKAKHKVVAINTMPLLSVGVMTVRGGDSPGSRSVPFVAVPFEAVPFEAMTRVLGEHWWKMCRWERSINKLRRNSKGTETHGKQSPVASVINTLDAAVDKTPDNEFQNGDSWRSCMCYLTHLDTQIEIPGRFPEWLV